MHHFVDRETTTARKRVEEVATAIKQEPEAVKTAAIVELTTTMTEETFGEILNAMVDSLSNIARSLDVEDVKDKGGEEEHTERGMLCEDDNPVWVIDTISKMVI